MGMNPEHVSGLAGWDQFRLDEAWNPVSYFEEEDEATRGIGDDLSGTNYAPSHLQTLFNSSMDVVSSDLDLLQKCRSLSVRDPDEQSLVANDLPASMSPFLHVDDTRDLHILDSSYSIDDKPILNDIQRLKRWQDTETQEESFISGGPEAGTSPDQSDLDRDARSDSPTALTRDTVAHADSSADLKTVAVEVYSVDTVCSLTEASTRPVSTDCDPSPIPGRLSSINACVACDAGFGVSSCGSVVSAAVGSLNRLSDVVTSSLMASAAIQSPDGLNREASSPSDLRLAASSTACVPDTCASAVSELVALAPDSHGETLMACLSPTLLESSKGKDDSIFELQDASDVDSLLREAESLVQGSYVGPSGNDDAADSHREFSSSGSCGARDDDRRSFSAPADIDSLLMEAESLVVRHGGVQAAGSESAQTAECSLACVDPLVDARLSFDTGTRDGLQTSVWAGDCVSAPSNGDRSPLSFNVESSSSSADHVSSLSADSEEASSQALSACAISAADGSFEHACNEPGVPYAQPASLSTDGPANTVISTRSDACDGELEELDREFTSSAETLEDAHLEGREATVIACVATEDFRDNEEAEDDAVLEVSGERAAPQEMQGTSPQGSQSVIGTPVRRVRFADTDSYQVANARRQSDATTDSDELEQYLDEPVEPPPRGDARSLMGSEDQIRQLGWFAPMWIPDSDARNCMLCDAKFTVVKRRHHCRACGKVLCANCCSMRFNLPYMQYKPARVCQPCCHLMLTAQSLLPSLPQLSYMQSPATVAPLSSASSRLPEAPPPYSEDNQPQLLRTGSNTSDAPPYTEALAAGPAAGFTEQPAPINYALAGMDILPTLRSPGFPGSPINDMLISSIGSPLPPYNSPRSARRQNRLRSESEMSAVIMFNSTSTNLPPVLRRDGEELRIVNSPGLTSLFAQMKDEAQDAVSFIVNKNLVVKVKVINMDCCVEKTCWCFSSDGMGASNQEELVIVVKLDTHDGIDEIEFVRRVLQQINAIFEKAKHGNPVSDLDHVTFDSYMCLNARSVGMIFFKTTLQCTKKLMLPSSPHLLGLYIHQSEIPWAKNIPLRLLLRIGAEFKYYPCPLFNVVNRESVYGDVGRTILDLLADFRNFKYTLPRIAGVTVNLQGKDTILRLPQHRYDEILKALNAAEESVLSLAGNFSSTCDGHLVSIESDGRYKTQTLSIVLKENRKVTCGTFIVISAAMKANPEGVVARASIVEDGVMVQVTADVMKALKSSIKEMKEYSVKTGAPDSGDQAAVSVEWYSSETVDRPKLISPIDGTSFDNLTNMKIRHSYDYTSSALTAKIHWVEVYFLPQDNDTVQRLSARELGQMTSSIAKSCMSALSPYLMTLIALDMTRIGLRVNLAADFVEYKIGANMQPLPSELALSLDDKLVPAIHGVMSSAQERVAVELIFQVVKIV